MQVIYSICLEAVLKYKNLFPKKYNFKKPRSVKPYTYTVHSTQYSTVHSTVQYTVQYSTVSLDKKYRN